MNISAFSSSASGRLSGCLVTIFGIVAVASFKMTPIYEAVSSIAINKTNTNLVNFKDSQNGGGYFSDPTTLDTEVTILQSDLLALQVIKATEPRQDLRSTAVKLAKWSHG